MGGGTGVYDRVVARAKGLSPRGRGNLLDGFLASPFNRSIPAWAGEPPRQSQCRSEGRVYPRVGGGTACQDFAYAMNSGLSPRGRGNHFGVAPGVAPSRSIPAWAGEPAPAVAETSCRAVYPRVGGGTVLGSMLEVPVSSLSPRGRGNRPKPKLLHGPSGSIPAWAGEPRRKAPWT